MSEIVVSPARIPHRALRAAVFLILVQCALLGYPSRSWIVPGLLSLAALSRLWTIRWGWISRLPTLWNALFLAVVFALKFTLFPVEYSSDAPFINTELAHEVGGWLIALQLLVLHEPRSLKRIPATVGAMGCLVVVCAGDIRLHSLSREIMLTGMVLFVGGLGWFAHASRNRIRVDQKRRLRRFILAGTLLGAGIPTVLAAQAWHMHERDLEQLLIQLMRSLDGEHSDTRSAHRSFLNQISNGRIQNPEQIVLKVRQNTPEPSYLRGWSYDEYASSSWSIARLRREPHELIEPRIPTSPGPWPDNQPLFPLHTAASNEWSTVEVQYFPEAEPYPFIPWETAELELPISQMNIDSRQNLSLIEDSMPTRLVAYVPSKTVDDPEPGPEAAVTDVPDKLDPRIRQLAGTVLQGTHTDRERIQAVVNFFHSNFQYQLGLEPPWNQDPITHFLVERANAHCEYFASGAALLLRLGGVPTRYVTGYVPSEYHPGGFWLARRKDGHAWVEAYDRELRHWVTVEATPSAGLPDRRDASWSEAMAERWRTWREELQLRFAEFGTLSALGLILQTTPARIILGLTFIVAWVLIALKYRRAAPVTRMTTIEKQFRSHQLDELEQLLARQGFERRPAETLLQFRDRIAGSPDRPKLQPVVDWYGAYGLIRYDDVGRTEEQLSELEATWRRIHS